MTPASNPSHPVASRQGAYHPGAASTGSGTAPASPGASGHAVAELECWKRIGVYGASTCPELAVYVHCRNCPVYSKAGRETLDRPLPADYRQEWTRHFAAEQKSRDRSVASAVPFRIGSEWLAIPTTCFQEVTERRTIHSVPHTESFVLGLANVRGELLMCVSLGHILGLPNVPPCNLLRVEHNRLLVLSCHESRIGFPVDEVHGPHRFFPEQIKPAAALLARANPGFAESVLEWQQHSLVVLDPDLLLSALHRSLA